MKYLLLVFLSIFIGINADRFCYKQVLQDCATNTHKLSCNADFGNFHLLEEDFNDLFKNYLMRSNEYLLISTNFHGHEFARDGFGNFFGELSDHKWESAIRLMRYINSRNGHVEFGCGNAYTSGKYDLYEINALSYSVDIEKEFTRDTNEIHKKATTIAKHDIDVARYLERKFAFQQSGILRQVTGYVTELSIMMDSNNQAVALENFNAMMRDETC